MRTLLVAAAVALGSSPAWATSIVIYQEQHRVLVGADSLRQVNGQPTAVACKINQIGDGHYAAVSGLTGRPAAGLDVWKLVREAASPGGHLTEKMSRLDALLPGPLKRALRGSTTKTVVEVVFVGVAGPDPHVVARRYNLEANGQDVVVTIDRCADCQNSRVLILGQTTPPMALLKRDPILMDRDPLSVIRALIGEAMKKVPEMVGPPVNILEARRGGAKWVQGGENCPWTP